MLTSIQIAESKVSLFFTCLERCEMQSVVSTILASFPDLLVRHPNVMEPWTKHVIAKLNDPSSEIKAHIITIINVQENFFRV